MTLEQLLDEIDHLSVDERAKVKSHIVELDATDNEPPLFGTSPLDNDLMSIVGLIDTSVTDLSERSREYLQEIFWNKDARPR